MRLNSMISEEPYQGLTCQVKSCRKVGVRKALGTGAAWLSSAGAVRCSLKWGNLRNPRPAFHVSRETARDNLEEGEDDAKSAWPLSPGQHTWYNGRDSGLRSRKVELIPETRSQFGSRSATRPREAGIASNRGSATPR